MLLPAARGRGWTALLQFHPRSLNHSQHLPPALKIRKGEKKPKMERLPLFSVHRKLLVPLNAMMSVCFLAGLLPREPAPGDGSASHGLYPAHLHGHRLPLQPGGFPAQITSMALQGLGVTAWGGSQPGGHNLGVTACMEGSQLDWAGLG